MKEPRYAIIKGRGVARFEDIRKGDKFWVFEADGVAVDDGVLCLALANAVSGGTEGVPGIKCRELPTLWIRFIRLIAKWPGYHKLKYRTRNVCYYEHTRTRLRTAHRLASGAPLNVVWLTGGEWDNRDSLT